MAGIGATLADARIRRGLTIEQAAGDTRISARFLEALEGERFHELPAPVYVRGFLRSYANYLKLDPQPLLDDLRLGDGPVSGPDSFVKGPRTTSQRGVAPGRRPAGGDPFRRQPPEPAHPVSVSAEPFEDEEEADDRPVVGARRPAPPVVMSEPPAVGRVRETAPPPPPPPPPVQFAEPEPEPEYDDYEEYEDGEAAAAPYPLEEETYHSPRVAGVLLERPDAAKESAKPTRVLMLVAGGLLVLVVALGAAVLLTRGGGGSSKAASTTPTAAPTYSTVVAVGSPVKSPSPSASVSPTASVSPSPSASVSPSPTGTVTTTPTPSPTQAGVATQPPAPTQTPTPSPTPTNTPTPVPTAPPTPTPTVVQVPPHPAGLSGCTNNDCHSADGYIYVVCAPASYGGWFVDKSRSFSNPLGWPVRQLTTSSQIPSACP